MRKQFSYVFIARVKELLFAGVTSNAELAAHLKTDEQTLSDWRRAYPEFDRACTVAVDEVISECAQRMLRISRDGDMSATKFILERRGGPHWRPSSRIDHTSNGQTLAGILAEHGHMDDDEARERELIYDDPEEGEQSSYSDEGVQLDEFDEDGEPI